MPKTIKVPEVGDIVTQGLTFGNAPQPILAHMEAVVERVHGLRWANGECGPRVVMDLRVCKAGLNEPRKASPVIAYHAIELPAESLQYVGRATMEWHFGGDDDA